MEPLEEVVAEGGGSLICEIIVWLIFGIGSVCALVLAFMWQVRKKPPRLAPQATPPQEGNFVCSPSPSDGGEEEGEDQFPSCGGVASRRDDGVVSALSGLATLQRRPFTFIHAVPVMVLTGVAALMHALQSSGEGKHVTPAMLIWGVCISAMMGFSVIAFCTLLTRRGPRAIFGSDTCTWKTAAQKGFLYGFAAIPVVWLVSLVVVEIGKALDWNMASQDVFGWLGDPSFPVIARAVLICSVVVIAPVTEELLFRGILLPALMKGRSFVYATVLSSFYFSLIHLNGASFVSLMVLSVMFSAGYAATGCILTPIIMHVIFNVTGILDFFAGKG